MCQLGGSLAEKDLGILVDTTVNMSQQSAFATKANDVTGFPSNIIPSCIIPSNRVSKVILPLYSALERPHLECSVCFWLHERHGQTGESPTKGHKDDQRTGAFLRREKHWHMLPREVMEFPSLEIIKSCLYTVLGNWLLSVPG
ncbi:hypothetical protein HGM15179_002136 [Zosterops borbonicus]|uniref:Uncharacterized protein n=1 Tax=Zosterops borbonicus TaxID=364589 RepID=A0A8K1GT84_9PASS|nr:hypothetical protein HGM15179_002136 [Zosterops borbonicus]